MNNSKLLRDLWFSFSEKLKEDFSEYLSDTFNSDCCCELKEGGFILKNVMKSNDEGIFDVYISVEINHEEETISIYEETDYLRFRRLNERIFSKNEIVDLVTFLNEEIKDYLNFGFLIFEGANLILNKKENKNKEAA